jgi:hypothetical protein
MRKEINIMFSYLKKNFPSIEGCAFNRQRKFLSVNIDYKKIDFSNYKIKDINIPNYFINEFISEYDEIFEISDYDDKDYTNIEKYEFQIYKKYNEKELEEFIKYLNTVIDDFLVKASITNLAIEINFNYNSIQ